MLHQHTVASTKSCEFDVVRGLLRIFFRGRAHIAHHMRFLEVVGAGVRRRHFVEDPPRHFDSEIVLARTLTGSLEPHRAGDPTRGAREVRSSTYLRCVFAR